VTVDLEGKTATVWTGRRGDDRWLLLIDAAAIDPKIGFPFYS
jgi:hypothetical protein